VWLKRCPVAPPFTVSRASLECGCTTAAARSQHHQIDTRVYAVLLPRGVHLRNLIRWGVRLKRGRPLGWRRLRMLAGGGRGTVQRADRCVQPGKGIKLRAVPPGTRANDVGCPNVFEPKSGVGDIELTGEPLVPPIAGDEDAARRRSKLTRVRPTGQCRRPAYRCRSRGSSPAVRRRSRPVPCREEARGVTVASTS
jgi:hypothetical protein